LIDYKEILGDQINPLSQQSRSIVLVNQVLDLERPRFKPTTIDLDRIAKYCSNGQETFEFYKRRVEAFDQKKKSTRMRKKKLKCKRSYSVE